MKHASLQHPSSDLIAGRFVPVAGDALRSINPAAPSKTVWSGSPVAGHVDEAVGAARTALHNKAWARLRPEDRFGLLRRYAELAKERAPKLAELICDETGKAWWEATMEAGAIADKVGITLDPAPQMGMSRVSTINLELSSTRRGVANFRPHGVMAVVGPFNFPAHLANGHIVPALAMGNTVVFKPSDKTPGVGQFLGELFHDAGFPAGVVNVVQGGADVAKRLVAHDDIDGVLFTGSWPVGRSILQANLDRPGRIVALELGGSNPAVVMADADLRQAVIECVRAGFATTGQRCTCTRRVIVHESIADRFVRAMAECAKALTLGDPRGVGDASLPPDKRQPVFMGPIIRDEARAAALAFQKSLAGAGGRIVLESRAAESPTNGYFITPGLVRVDRFTRGDDAGRDAGCDVEVFGPILRVSTCRDLDDALDQANATRYGLAASIFTKDEDASDRFLRECRAGCVNVNTGTAGASSKLPFGGLGQSGNHRPAGSFSLDYCAYPVASMIETGPAATTAPGMRFEDAWL